MALLLEEQLLRLKPVPVQEKRETRTVNLDKRPAGPKFYERDLPLNGPGGRHDTIRRLGERIKVEIGRRTGGIKSRKTEDSDSESLTSGSDSESD